MNLSCEGCRSVLFYIKLVDDAAWIECRNCNRSAILLPVNTEDKVLASLKVIDMEDA